MAKLYFRYGAMNSGKSANLLMVADNYIKQGRRVLILKPAKDTRWDMVRSRAISDALPAELVAEDADLFAFVAERHGVQQVDAVLVEEAQFLLAPQVRQLALVVDELSIPVLCYGLRCSFIDGQLFEGSAALMYWADTIEEIKNVCQYCTSKATKNLLRINGVPQYEGTSDVVMGDVNEADVSYTPTCRKHYLQPVSAE
jgi:thymidine kinase